MLQNLLTPIHYSGHVSYNIRWHNSFLLTSIYCTKLLACLTSGGFLTSHSRLPVWLAEDAPLGDEEVDGRPLLWGTTPFCLSLELESECSSLSSDFALRNRPPAPLALFNACWCRDSWRYGLRQYNVEQIDLQVEVGYVEWRIHLIICPICCALVLPTNS